MVSLVKSAKLQDIFNQSDGGIVALDYVKKSYIGLNIEDEYISSDKLTDLKNIVPIVDYKKGRRSVVYASGMSGSGKSSFSLAMISASVLFLSKVTDMPMRLIIVTRESVEDDDNYKSNYYGLPSIASLVKSGNLHVSLFTAEELVAEKMLETFLPSCKDYITFVLLDDMDSIVDFKEYYMQFQHLLLTRARKFRTHVFICNHRAADVAATRHILGELTSVWIPTRSKISSNFKKMLEKHAYLRLIEKSSVQDYLSSVKKDTRFVYLSIDNPYGVRYFVQNNIVFEE